ncbi:MAG TPA: hypothetical protein VF316_02250 [Polyangiaceae bacterium]
MRSVLARTLGSAALVAIMGCLPPPPPHVPVSPPTGRASYQYAWAAPGSRPSGSAGVTVTIVNPQWAQDSIVLQQGYKNFAAGFTSSLGADLDKILVGKGVNVSGPHRTYDDITYPDKRAADFALTPVVFLTASLKWGVPAPVGSGGVADYVERKFSLTAQGFVEFVLVEPLSRQKLWVKKLDLEPQSIEGVEVYAANVVNDPATGQALRVDVGPLLYDGKQDAMADAMTRWYPTIAEKAFTYLDTEEMASLKPQTVEIREHAGSIIH